MGHRDTNVCADLEVGSVKIVIGEENRQVRQAITSSLFFAGFRDIVDTNSMTQVRDVLSDVSVDLMICSTGLAGGGVHDFLGRLRAQDLGRNPFVVAILLLAETTQQAAIRALAAGPDALVVKPFAAGDILRWISSLAKNRKPFVVTHDYVGPNRRLKHRPGTERFPVIDVPNPLGPKIPDGSPSKSYAQEIESCAKVIRDLRLERSGRQIQFVVNRLVETIGNGAGKQASDTDLCRLLKLTLELEDRTKESRFGPIHDACHDLHGLAANARQGDGMAWSDDLLEMKSLSNRIDGAFRSLQPALEWPLRQD